MVQVRFGDTLVTNNFVPTVTAQEPISVEWNSSPNRYTTLIMYSESGEINLLITNVLGDDVSRSTSIVPYRAPNAQYPQTYFVDIYSQTGLLSTTDVSNLSSFVRDNNLRLLDRTSFKVGSMIPTPKSVVSSGPSVSLVPASKEENFFLPGTSLTEQQQKWCRCVLKVADKQKGACNIEQAWFQQRDGKQCYNIYAVCSKSVGTSVRNCGDNYNFEALSDDHLLAYAQLHQKKENKIVIPVPYNRNQMLQNIREWKQRE